MKKLVLLIFTLPFFVSAFAQNTQQYLRPSSIGFSFVFYDFQTPQRIQNSSLSTVVRDKQTADFGEMGTGIAVSYFKGLHNKIDFAGTFSIVSAEYSLPDRSGDVNAEMLMQADASLQFKMLPDRYLFSPYLSAGAGANKYGPYMGAYIPLGVGFKFNFFEEASVFVNAKYHVPVTQETVRGHFVYGFGIAGIVGEKRAATKTVPLP